MYYIFLFGGGFHFLAVFLHILGQLSIHDRSLTQIRDVSQKKTGKCGNFFQVGDPSPPLPPVWEFFPDFTVYFWKVSHVKNSKKMEVGFG